MRVIYSCVDFYGRNTSLKIYAVEILLVLKSMVGIPGSQDREAPAAAWGRFCETVLAEIKQKK
jgi:hypothetical protein